MANDQQESLRQLGAKHWQFAITLLAVASAIGKFLYDLIQGPVTLQTWITIAVAVVFLIVIRRPSVAMGLTWLIFGSPPVPANPPKIFRGPLPYMEGEPLPGRQADVDTCFLLLQRNPFLVLEGESGCGKTSLLNAALLPRARERFRVVECRVANDPLGKLLTALLHQPYQDTNQFATKEDLINQVKSAIATYATSPEDSHSSMPVLLCIDQLEELFVTVKGELRSQFLSILREAIESGQLRLLLSLRNDFRDLLIDLCRTVDPDQQILNIGIYHTLKPFSEAQALTVLSEMFEPIDRDEPLRKQIHDDFAKKLVLELLLPPRDRRLFQDDDKAVLPVELQIVGVMIESGGIENFSADGLRQLGGKTELIRKYIEEAEDYVRRKTGISGDAALLVLRRLISPAGTKWTQTSQEISATVGLTSSQVGRVLDAFAEKLLVKRLPDTPGASGPQGSPPEQDARYELMHEHLVSVLMEAPQPILQKARDAEERLQFWRKRTSDIASLADEPRPRPALLDFFRRLFAQPIPIIESLRLWRFATSREDRRMLWGNLRGFLFKFGSVVIFLSLLGGLWVLRTRSDSYQIATVVREAPLDQPAGADSPTQAVEWIKALVHANNVDAAFEAGRKIKNINERSKAFAIICLELTKLSNFERAESAIDESLATERFSWDVLHSDAIATLIQHMPATQLETVSARALGKKMDDYRNRTQYLAAVSEGLFRAGKNEQAAQVFAEAMAAGNLINQPKERFETLMAVMGRLINEKRINDASSVLETAAVTAQAINDRHEKFQALINTAENYARAGNSDKAADILKQALALDPDGLNSNNDASITALSEEMSKAGKDKTVVDIVRNSGMPYYKDRVLAAVAAGLCRTRQDEEVLSLFGEIKSNNQRFDVLVKAAYDSIEKSRLNLARKLLDMASQLLSTSLARAPDRNPWKFVAIGMLRVNETEKAIDIARQYEQIGTYRLGYMFMDDERIGPLAEIAKKLAEQGLTEKAYAISHDIKYKLDMYYALTAILVAEIKAGHLDKAKQVQTELLAIPKSTQNDIFPDTEEAFFQRYLIDIAVALAQANRLEDALVIVREIKKADDRYTALERIAKELILLGKKNEALDVIDKSDQSLQSRSLANLAEWLLNTEKRDTIVDVLPRIAFGDDKSRATAALAKLYARSGSFRLARSTAESCSSQSDQLSAYTVILNEYASRRNHEASGSSSPPSN